jgi:hypothetical protein
MPPINVVLAHQDPGLANNLVHAVEKQYLNLTTAKNKEEIRSAIVRVKAPLAVVDLELVNFKELGELCSEFPATAFVSTHRLADDTMWTRSLGVGAVDCCLASDLPHVLQASDRYIAIRKAHAVPAA